MNSVQDPSKKTSITSLLNPQDASNPFPNQYNPRASTAIPNQPHDHQPVAVYGSSYSQGSSFNLRAANWDTSADAAKRRQSPPENGAHPHQRHYPPPHLATSTESYTPNVPQKARNRALDPPRYPGEGAVWMAQQSESQNSYGGSTIAPMYSDERTALSGDYHSENNQHPQQNTRDHPPNPYPPQTVFQTTERVSVRLAARGTMADPSPPSYTQDSRYSAATTYYPPPNVYPGASMHPQHRPHASQQSETQSGLQSQPHNLYTPGQAQTLLQTQAQPQAQKRSLADGDASAPAKKRAKPKTRTPAPDGSTNGNGTIGAPSKRGYNAKKRSEAAQIAAQNALMLPTVTYTPAPGAGGKGKERDAELRMHVVPADGSGMPPTSSSSGPGPDPSGPQTSATLQPELQFARCMSNRYRAENFPRCVSCTRRWAGDTCRFQGIRFFLKDATRTIVGISFVESQKADGPTMRFPTKWNVKLGEKHVRRTKRTIAKALLPTLRKELDHLMLPEVIRRPRESEVRATCDTCMTSIFSSSWMCRLCGREACAECFAQVKELTEDRPGADLAEMAALIVRREKYAHSNPFFLSCTRRAEHQAKDFSPMSRFCRDELEQAIEEMDKIVEEDRLEEEKQKEEKPEGESVAEAEKEKQEGEEERKKKDGRSECGNGVEKNAEGAEEKTMEKGAGKNVSECPVGAPTIPESNPQAILTLLSSSPGTSNVPDGAISHLPIPVSTTADLPYIPNNLSPATLEIPYHKIMRFSDADLSGDSASTFAPIWTKGVPLLVTGILPKFKINWTPDYFRSKYGGQACLVIECQTDMNRRVTVGEFFGWFGQYEGRSEYWKLKDWPPSTDFKSAFPELYTDFSQAVPVPDYVRRDGVYNIGSHFPSNTVGPDLGPKMYNAMASSLKPGSKGSTRLHMDMADALNVMTYAEKCEDGTPGCAAWDLFRAEDSYKLRTFLRKRFSVGAAQDPIHSQLFYLDDELRNELWNDFGVMSYRIYQRPGEAVFIPAGCAHQVANLADCVKVAIDFVSPENIGRCEVLTKEFREQNQSMVWKEDVLQLRTMMWFAWLSCCQQERDTATAAGLRANGN